jgi:hypothetical protein
MSNAEDARRGQQPEAEDVPEESQEVVEAHGHDKEDRTGYQDMTADIWASNEARQEAEEHHIDPSEVQASGAGGRIEVEDVRRARRSRVNSEGEEDGSQNGNDAVKAAETFWRTFIRLEQNARAGETPPTDDPAANIIAQYNALRAVLAGPSETEETKVPEPVKFEPTPDKDFAPNTPLADWKPRRLPDG